MGSAGDWLRCPSTGFELFALFGFFAGEKDGINQIFPKFESRDPRLHLLAGCSTAEEPGRLSSDQADELRTRV